MHQERQALKKNLSDLKSSMSTRDNIYYTKMRDDIEAKYKRLNNVKKREVETQNEKMYGKLLSILDNEKRSITKHKANLGPISLNVGVRRRTINTINNENEVISKKLNEIKC
jgi:molecular chaperone GrpE (heat shock protein)